MIFQPELELSDAADVLLRGSRTLSLGERELIAMHVSAESDCIYCQTVHGAIATHHLGGDDRIVAQVRNDFRKAPISEKLKALLIIAGKVQRDGKHVTAGDINRARRQGATDLEIHDTVLIAAMFCMCTGNGWAPESRARRSRRTGGAQRKSRAKSISPACPSA